MRGSNKPCCCSHCRTLLRANSVMHLTTFIGDCNCSTVLSGIVVFLGLLYFLKSRRPKNFPPGPRGLPIVGYTPFLGSNAAETMRKMKPKYGPVMSVQMGSEDWVILNDYETINDALVKQGEIFSGRPSNFVFEAVADGKGILTADYGPVWKNLRKFGLMTLRGFGVGKKSMEQNVEEEMPYLIENLLTKEDTRLSMKLAMSVSNIICRVVFGSRFAYDDKRFMNLIRIIREAFAPEKFDTKIFGILTMVPVLRHIPPFSGAFGRIMKELDSLLGDTQSRLQDSVACSINDTYVHAGDLQELIDEHKDSFDDNDLRDFVDAFLKEMKGRGNGDPTFCEGQLLQFIRDLFDAGTGTTSTTLTWAILCFAHYPECQEKIAKEVEHVIGESGIPTMKKREEMPYTCAFIHEIMRHRTLLPLSLFHKTNKEATLCGYTIPKNTTVAPNLWSVHMDPNLFENPEKFRPERFLNKDRKFVKSNHVIPFSVGPRHCLGEQLARMELFIFLTGIIQKLKVIPDPINPPPPFNEEDCSNMINNEPPNFTVKFVTR